jgi:hypothetical protein
MSNYNDKSKDPRGTAAVTQHFFSSDNVNRAGEASGKGNPPGGTNAWDTGTVNSAGDAIFNDDISTNKLPAETGVNYTPRSQAGHRLTEKPFQGAADGLPGNKRMLWD